MKFCIPTVDIASVQNNETGPSQAHGLECRKITTRLTVVDLVGPRTAAVPGYGTEASISTRTRVEDGLGQLLSRVVRQNGRRRGLGQCSRHAGEEAIRREGIQNGSC